jgi:ankyrin repeat domain-containing protein 50
LGDLPDGLDATYDRMLQSIKPKYRSRVANILTWLSFSIRPLFVKELAEIFILDRERKPPFEEADRLNLPESVLNYLPSLITKVLRGGENDLIEIRLAHFLIKEYLISPRISQGPAKYFFINERDAHLHISEDCLAYHLHLSSTILVTEEQFVGFALWNYAVGFWVDHLEQVPRPSWTSSATEMALKAFTPGSQSLLIMNRLRDPDKKHKNWDLKFSDLVSPLYYMAANGNENMVQLLLN